MRKHWIIGLTALLAAQALSAEVLFEQTQFSGPARAADYGTASQSGFRTLDDFTLASGGIVETITWRGLYLGAPQPAAPPVEDVTSWRLSFHSDNAGFPGGELMLAILSSADVTSTLVGTSVFSAGALYDVNIYEYSAVLPTAFHAAAGQKYWLGFLGISENFSPIFALLGSDDGDSRAVQETLGAGMVVTATNPRLADEVFRLEGTALPEPATYAMLAAGLVLGFAGRRLRA